MPTKLYLCNAVLLVSFAVLSWVKDDVFRLNIACADDALEFTKYSGSHWHTAADKFVSLTGCEALAYLTE